MNRVLSIIVISQFFCTSLWFAGNAILSDILINLQLNQSFLAHLTSAVQFGFITGTLAFALFTISDRFSPSKVFFISALIAGLCNLAISIEGIPATGLLSFRFLTGFFLAGIYPVGMKIASDYYQKGLGKSLGLIVGALVIGTAFPHLLKSMTATLPWKYVVYFTSSLSFVGGLTMVLLVPDGPYRKSGLPLKFISFLEGFKNKKFKSAALGYFGHMWELYTFWAFVPVMLATHNAHHGNTLNVSFYSFLIIALGGGACVLTGLLSQTFKPKTLATLALFLSGLCCVLSPLFLFQSSLLLLLIFLFFWSIVVIADSPLFSTLVAQYAPEESRGTSLTIVNCIGFAITIASIQSIGALTPYMDEQYIYLLLAIGPIFGLIALLRDEESPLNINPGRTNAGG
jgi:MFS family permease